jgi:hypothetical protein
MNVRLGALVLLGLCTVPTAGEDPPSSYVKNEIEAVPQNSPLRKQNSL